MSQSNENIPLETGGGNQEDLVKEIPSKSTGKELHIDFLHDLQKIQTANGISLQNSNFGRYRQYCTRRVARLRERSGLKQVRSQGKRMVYLRVEESPEKMKHELALWIPAMLAERSWAYFMELNEDDAEEQSARVRAQARSRLRKAALWAKKFHSLCESVADPRTTVEAEGYSKQMNARSFMESGEWSNALSCLLRAKTIFESLCKLGDGSLAQVCAIRLREVTQSIRLAKYHGADKDGKVDGGESAADLLEQLSSAMQGPGMESIHKKLEQAVGEHQAMQASSLHQIDWRGKSIPIKSPKVRQCLVRLNQLVRELDRERYASHKLVIFDRLLMAYSDAFLEVRNREKELQEDQHKSAKTVQQLQHVETLKEYLNVERVRHTLQRDLCLIELHRRRLFEEPEPEWMSTESTTPAAAAAVVTTEVTAGEGSVSKTSQTAVDYGKQPSILNMYLPQKRAIRAEDLVRLYDTVITGQRRLIEMRNQDDVEESSLLEATLLGFQAHRCFYVALVYADVGDMSAALALLSRASERTQTAIRQFSECKHARDPLSVLEKLLALIRSRVILLQGEDWLKKEKQQTKNTAPKSMLDRVDECDASFLQSSKDHPPTIVEFPPNFEFMKTNPFLFDLALTSIDYPQLESHIAKEPEKKGFWRFW